MKNYIGHVRLSLTVLRTGMWDKGQGGERSRPSRAGVVGQMENQTSKKKKKGHFHYEIVRIVYVLSSVGYQLNPHLDICTCTWILQIQGRLEPQVHMPY